MEKTRRRNWRKSILGLSAIVFAASFVVSLVPSIRAIAEGALFKIKSAEITQLSSGVDGAISSHDDSTIVSDVTFHKLGDTVTYKVVLQNTDSKDHVIETISDDNANSHISYSYDKHANETIAAGANLDFIFEAKYVKTPNINERQQVSKVKFSIHFTDIDEPEEVIVAPSTYDGLGASFVVLAISSLGLIVCAAIYIKNHKKAAKVLTVALVAALATAAIASVKAATVEVNSFTLTTNYGFYDKVVITYTDKNGDEQEIISNYNEPAHIPDQSKDGYTLTGWEDEQGNPVDPTQPITEDVKIHPVYRAHTYTVKFNGNGATSGEMADLAMTYDEAKTLPTNAFDFPGRTYTGWDTEANGSGIHYDNGAEVKNLTTEDNGIVTLYAQWSINPFHIDYDGNGATSGEMATTNCEYDQACQLRDSAFEKYGYDFAGWKYNGTIYADKADVTNIIDKGTITMVAQWTPHVYTITYTGLANEEAADLRAAGNPDTYTIESPSFTLKNPDDRYDTDGDKTQHFEGWRESTVSTEITLPQVSSLGNKIYEAIWSDVATPEYTITYEYNNGTATPANRTEFTKFDTFTLTEPTKEGYTFTGWTGTDLANETKPYTVPTGIRHDLEFTAHYRKNNYTIAFAKGADDATGVTASIAAEYDTEYNLPASGFARTGYTQNGWKKGEEAIAADAKVKNLTAEDGATITLTANWEANHYTIKFEKNAENVEGMINPIDATYGTDVALSCNGFAKEHYKLMGWASSSTGSAVYECDASVKNLTAEPNGEVTLYAVWLERTAMLNTGSNVNTALKAINADATTFTHYTGTPEIDAIENKRDIALATSNFPVYIWDDNSTIYWWSEAENVYMNADSGSMFKGTNFVSIDASGFDASTATNMQLMFIDTRNVENINISGWDTSNVTSMYAMFNRAGVNKEGPISVDLTELDVQNVLSFNQMFKETKFVSMDLSSWNVESVKDTTSMFSSMPNLTTLDISGFNLSGLGSNRIALFDPHNPSVINNSLRTSPTTIIADSVVFNENMSDLFYSQVNLTEVSLAGVDTSRTTNMNRLLQLCTSLTSVDLRDVDFENVTDMSGMFAKDSNLETVLFADNINTGNVTTMAGMFNEAEKLSYVDVSHFNTSNVTNMLGMFRFTPLLTTVDVSHFDTSKLEGSIESLFSKNGATELDLSTFDTSRITIMRNLFLNNTAVTTIYATDRFVTTLVPDASVNTDGHNLFSNTPNLVGGAGTAYTSSTPRSKEYARIDDPDNGNPGYFTMKNARYIRYNGNGADNATPYGAMRSEYLKAGGSLTKNAFVRDGYVFTGWKDADNNEYTDEQVMTDLAESKTPLELYAQWKVPVVDFIPAEELRLKMTSLATNDNNIKQFIPYPGTPDLDNISYEIVSTNESDFPIYMWYDSSNNAIYYWCEWERPRMYGALTNLFSTTSNIENVDFSAIDLSGVTSAAQLFSQKTKLKSVDFGNWDASNVTDMYRMFYYAFSLETVDLSNFNTTNLQGSLEGMFDHCESLKSIDFGDTFKTDNVTNMHTMFQNNTSLEELDLSSFNTGNVETMYYMFASDAALASIDFGNNFNTAKVTNMGWMFFNCRSLNMLDLGAFSSDRLTTTTAMFRFAPLQTIYATGSFSLEGIDETTTGGQMTFANTNLIGGMGTSFAATDHKGAAYGRIDDPDNGNPGYFTIKGARYIRYNGNGADNATPYGTMTSEYLKAGDSLKTNAFTRNGYVFIGWKDADGNDYTDEQAMTDLTESKTPLELYAQWDAAPYTVTFNANGGEVLQSTKTVTYLQPYDELPTPVKYDYADSILGGKYSFKEWNTEADGSGDTITPSSIYANTDDTTLYAIWNDQFTVTIYNGESETPTTASYRIDDIVYLNAQNVAGKQFLYWEVDGVKKAYTKDYSMRMFQGKDLTIRAIYGSESDLESQQPGTYISDIYRQYSNNKVFVRSYSYVPDGYEIVKAGVVATLDANIANGTFDDQPETGKYVRTASVNGNNDNYYYTWSKSNVTSEQTVYVKAYLIYKDTDGVEHTIYGDLVTATLTE